MAEFTRETDFVEKFGQRSPVKRSAGRSQSGARHRTSIFNCELEETDGSSPNGLLSICNPIFLLKKHLVGASARPDAIVVTELAIKCELRKGISRSEQEMFLVSPIAHWGAFGRTLLSCHDDESVQRT
jgi:hypothetical protein